MHHIIGHIARQFRHDPPRMHTESEQSLIRIIRTHVLGETEQRMLRDAIPAATLADSQRPDTSHINDRLVSLLQHQR